ncbi:hypothetical protein RBB79_19005 [Tunturiibacter empetritectus]|uniref:DUF4148 domain-containing protein n=2 Tax=Tunturiibacter TaxID=3154218 RepID=A0A852VMW5_9BACT|nr:hypothetical protein [Edaphobacter lichenicola]NYF91754.1 hypothetical protein [Edaphobacter lichenicola]
MNWKATLLAASLVALPVSNLLAQSTTYEQRHSVNARDANQQARINKGVADGQITPKGAAAADAHQAHLNAEQSKMRAADNGHLTAQDRHKIARQQDRTSQHIYDRNHNAATDPGVPPR